MRKPFWILATLAALAACESKDDRIAFDGGYFRAKADKLDKEQRDHFTVTVKPVSESLDGAREAGRHEAITYCITNYGSSNIEWTQGPDADEVTVEDDTLMLAGICRP